MSAKLTLPASTRMRTWSGPGSGAVTSSRRSATDGWPNSWTLQARTGSAPAAVETAVDGTIAAARREGDHGRAGHDVLAPLARGPCLDLDGGVAVVVAFGLGRDPPAEANDVAVVHEAAVGARCRLQPGVVAHPV